jgi:hypothetical protein
MGYVSYVEAIYPTNSFHEPHSSDSKMNSNYINKICNIFIVERLAEKLCNYYKYKAITIELETFNNFLWKYLKEV